MSIQAFVSIFSLIPTEPLWNEIKDERFPPEAWNKDDLYESIKKDGLKYQFRIDNTGKILDGNGRYWTCRRLVLEGDTRFLIVPIEMDIFNGIVLINHGKTTPDVETVANTFYDRIDRKTSVIAGKQEFDDYTFDDSEHKHPYQGKYQSFHVVTQEKITLQMVIENSLIEDTEDTEEEKNNDG
jgi:hypothetical protein